MGGKGRGLYGLRESPNNSLMIAFGAATMLGVVAVIWVAATVGVAVVVGVWVEHGWMRACTIL